MRKFLGLAALVLMLTAIAPAAVAQPDGVRDPFAPLIAPPTTAPVPGEPVAPGEPVVPAPTSAPVDPLPDTGASTGSWVGLAYLLVALGAGTLVLSKVLGPVPVSTR